MKSNFMVQDLLTLVKQLTVMHNDEGESIDRAPNPMMILTMPVAQPVKPGDMIRKRK